MKSFGTILKEAREAKGLTTSQVAHDTHMLVQIVEEMEREDFHRIPAPIYGRGFVRLYAERVGLDPAPLITEFMEIFNGHKKPLASTPSTPPPPSPAPVPPPIPSAVEPPPQFPEQPPAVEPPSAADLPSAIDASAAFEPPPAALEPSSNLPPVPPSANSTNLNLTPPSGSTNLNLTPPSGSTNLNLTPSRGEVEVPPSLRGLDLFDPGAAESRPPVPPPPSVPPRGPDWESPFASAYSDDDEGPSEGNAAQRFRDGLSVVSHGVLGTVRQIPRSAWRIALLAIGALLVIALIIWGCHALYKATSAATEPAAATPPPTTSETVAVNQPSTPSRSDAKPAPSKAKPAATPAPAKGNASNLNPSSKGNGVNLNPSPSRAGGALKSTGLKIPPLYID